MIKLLGGDQMIKLLNRVKNYFLKRKDPIAYSRKIGVSVGEDCRFIGTPSWGNEPWLIKVGNHTEISSACHFVTHDGSTWVFRNQERYKHVIKFGKIKIGSDCFIGTRSTILSNVTIGDYSIVGACSLVNKSIPSGEVWGGVPARYICKTVDFAERCLENTPDYDLENYKHNFKDEVLKILR